MAPTLSPETQRVLRSHGAVTHKRLMPTATALRVSPRA
jgi:hypothetical protein